jgi:tRNA(adenine34) deaminase
MEAEFCRLIRYHYENSRGDSTQLFKTILSIAQETGLEEPLEFLEGCVIEKRLAWFEQNAKTLQKTGALLQDGYRLFYERYLGLSIPADGEIVEVTPYRLKFRWWNRCPTLEACRTLGLDTREICKKVYHRPVQVFLSRIDARLRFERNYNSLRPYTSYCEESLELVDP